MHDAFILVSTAPEFNGRCSLASRGPISRAMAAAEESNPMNRNKLRLRCSHAAKLGPLTVRRSAATSAEHMVECDGTRAKEN